VRAHLMFDLALGATVSSLLLIYLVWALVRPEDF
jgi:K+-transporting ATPase KdpF subunit